MAKNIYTLEGNFDVSKMLQSIEIVNKNLKNLNLPPNVLAGFDKQLTGLTSKIEKMKSKLDRGFSSPKELESFNKDLQEIFKSTQEIEDGFKEFNVSIKDVKNSSESLKDLRKELASINGELTKAKSKRINMSAEAKGNLSEEDKKKVSKARTSMNEVVKRGGSEQELQDVASKASKGVNPEVAKEINNILQQEIEKRREIVELMEQQRTKEAELTTEAERQAGSIDSGVRAQTLKEVADQTNNLGEASKGAEEAIRKQTEAEQNVSGLINRLKHLTSLTSVAMIGRRMIRSIITDIKDLDSAFNDISVVTGKTMQEMWNSFGQVNKMAQEYGVSTKGVVEVQNMYYHQGLNDIEVTKRTAETLTLAKIAGLEYADATDKMTAALNAFNMSADQAQRITDVTAALASNAAASSDEIMNALTKTASISASAGTSFENTEIFLTKMIETTRESSENLGTALKTITARFTELKTAQDADGDGEVADFNRVDTALKSVGISIKDASGQMKNFDDIILELSAKWDGLDRNTQRYIATQAAGSRQQSRFIALVEDYNRTLELQEVAENSAGTGADQLARAQESLDTAINKITASWQELYNQYISSNFIREVLELINQVITGFTNLGKTLGSFGQVLQIAIVGFGILGARIVTIKFEKLAQKIATTGSAFKKATKGVKDFSNSNIKGAVSTKQLTKALRGNITGFKDLAAKERKSLEIDKLHTAQKKAYIVQTRKQRMEDAAKALQNKTGNSIDLKSISYGKLHALCKKENIALTNKEIIAQEEENTIQKISNVLTAQGIAGEQAEAMATGLSMMALQGKISIDNEGNIVDADGIALKGTKLGLITAEATAIGVLEMVESGEIKTKIKDRLQTIKSTIADGIHTAAIWAKTIALVAAKAAMGDYGAAGRVAAGVAIVLGAAAVAGAVGLGAHAIATKKDTKAQKANAEAMDSSTESIKKYSETLQETKKMASDYAKALEYKRREDNLTSEEQQEYQGILQGLQEEYPELIKVIDAETLSLNDNQKAWEDVINTKKRALEQEANDMTNAFAYTAINGVIKGTKAEEQNNNTMQVGNDFKNHAQYYTDVVGTDKLEDSNLQGAFTTLSTSGFNLETVQALLGNTDIGEGQFASMLQQISNGGKLDNEGFYNSIGLNKDEGKVLQGFVDFVNAQSANAITEYAKAISGDEYQTQVANEAKQALVTGYAAALGETMNDDVANMMGNYVAKNNYTDETADQLVQQYYNMTQEVRSGLENALKNVKNKTTSADASEYESYILSSIPGEVSDETKAQIQNYSQLLAEEAKADWEEIKNSGVGDVSGLTLEEAKALSSNYATIMSAQGEEAAEAFKKGFTDIIDNTSDAKKSEVSQYMSELVTAESLEAMENARQKLLKLGVSSKELEKIIRATGKDGEFAFINLDDAVTELTKHEEKLKKVTEAVSNAIKGAASLEDMKKLLETFDNLKITDFTATADGFKIDPKKLGFDTLEDYFEDYYAAQIQQNKNALATLLRDTIDICEEAYGVTEDKLREFGETYMNETEAKHAETIAAMVSATGMSEELVKQFLENYKGNVESIISTSLAGNQVIKNARKEAWEAEQEQLQKAADKAKEIYDRWKDIYDMIKGIDPTKTLETMAELLELDNETFEATLTLNINPTINKQALQDRSNNINSQIAVQSQIEQTKQQEAQAHKKVIDSSKYMTVNGHGVAKVTDNIQELYNKAKNAKNSDERAAYKEMIESIEGEIDAYNDSVKAAKEANKKKLELIAQQKEYYKQSLNQAATLERKIVDALIAKDKKELEQYQKMVDKKKEAQNEWLDSVQEAIDKERSMRDLAEKEEDLRKKERKLSILQMDTSGMYAGDVANLQADINKDHQSLQDTYVDNEINKLAKQIEDLQESYDKDIQAWEEYLEWKEEDMTEYQAEIEGIINQGTEAVTTFLMENSEEAIGKTKAEIEELTFTTQEETKAQISEYEYLKEGGYDPLLEALKEMETNTTSVEQATNKYTSTATTEYDGLKGTINQVTAALGNESSGQIAAINSLVTYWDKAFNAAARYADKVSSISGSEYNGGGDTFDNSTTGGTASNKSNPPTVDIKTNTTKENYSGANTLSEDISGILLWTNSDIEDKYGNKWVAADFGNHLVWIQSATAKQGALGLYSFSKGAKWYDTGQSWLGSNNLEAVQKAFKYREGGYVDYTGPAWVDGTKSNPEAFLDAQDTANIAALVEALQYFNGVSLDKGKDNAVQKSSQDTYNIEVNVNELSEDYTIDDLVEEIGEKIYNISTKGQTTRV